MKDWNHLIFEELEAYEKYLEERKEKHLQEGLEELELQQKAMEINLSYTELQVLIYVHHHPDCYGLEIAENLGLTRGGISKLVKRMEAQRLLESFQRDGEKKRIRYRLNDIGEKAVTIHSRLEQQNQQRIEALLTQYSEEEKQGIARFLKALRE